MTAVTAQAMPEGYGFTRPKPRRLDLPPLPTDALGRPIYDSYARMSDGFDGNEINVEAQFATNRRQIEARGGVVGREFSDPLSAWQRNVHRPEWAEMIWRMENRLSAGSAIYNIDRFLRQNRQLEWLFDVTDEMGCSLIAGGTTWRLDSEDDRMFLRMLVAQANKSSADTRRRVRDKNSELRRLGVLIEGGPRAFAWPGMAPTKTKGRKARQRRVEVAPERLEAERAALKWAFEFLDEGGKGGLTEIARRWNAADLRAYFGNDWNPVTVRQTMSKQRHAGRIEHDGKFVGNIADHEPLIESELFDRVQAIFAGRKRGGQTSSKSIGSGIIVCWKCDGRLVSRPRYRRDGTAVPAYRCCKPRGCGSTAIDQEPVDAALRELTIARLSDPKVAERVSAYAAEMSEDVKKARDQLSAARQTQANLVERNVAGDLPDDLFNSSLRTLSVRIRGLQEELAQLEAGAADTEAVRAQSELAVAQEWDRVAVAGDTERLRAMVQSALRLVEIEIGPGVRPDPFTGKGRERVPAEERIVLRSLGG